MIPASPPFHAVVRRALRGVFVLQFAALDVVTRPAPRVPPLLALLSLGVLCSWLDGRRWSRALAACTAAAYLVLVARFYRYYHIALDARVVESLLYSWGDVWPVLSRAAPEAALATGMVASLEYALLTASMGAFPRRHHFAPAVAAATLGLCVAMPAWAVSRRFFGSGSSRVRAAELPPLPSTRRALPNLLVVLTESVRAKDYCSAHGDDCASSPEVDALVPARLAFEEMRSLGSYTAVSVSALLGGRAPLGSAETIAREPGLFDFMKAVRAEGRAPTVAYWSAQTDSLLARRDVRHVVDSFVAVNDLVGHAVGDEDEVIDAGVDRLLTAYVEKHIRRLPQPFVLVLHFQGTHAPYFTDDAHAPFLPMRHAVTWSGLEELHNAYKDAIFEQDRSIARCLRAFFDASSGAPYAVFFTSDHGEAFGEHGAIHHGQNLYEEQIHVPAWLAAGNGALDDTQLEAARSYRDAPVTHLDVLPTLLDVAGVLDGYAIAPYRKALTGRSLVAPRVPLGAPVPLTNCTSLFPCPLETWGMLDDTRSLVAQPWDGDFRCTTLAGEAASANDAACDRLKIASRTWYATRPGGAPNH